LPEDLRIANRHVAEAEPFWRLFSCLTVCSSRSSDRRILSR